MLAKVMASVRRQLARIPDGKLSEVARRAGLSVRQLHRLRSGELRDVKVSTLTRLAEALGVPLVSLIGGSSPRPRRPAPVGRRRGRPRTMRRQQDVGELVDHDEDEEEHDV
jgi:transcriptional regulator with XRE-family HTH domain